MDANAAAARALSEPQQPEAHQAPAVLPAVLPAAKALSSAALRVFIPCIPVRKTTTTTTQTTARHVFSLATLLHHLRAANVSTRLSLMFLIPCYASVYWTTVGGIGLTVWRLALPKLRVIVVCLRQSLERLLRQPTAAFLFFRTTQTHHDVPDYYYDDDDHSLDSDEESFALIMETSLLASMPPPAETSPRHSTIQPITIPSVADILASGGPNSPIRAIPIERFGDPSAAVNTQPQIMPPPPTPSSVLNNSVPSPLRDRSISMTDRQTKRLSLNFPIQPPSSKPSRPPSWHASPILSPEVLASPTEGNFLTVLAAQERRVLELRDELRRAEGDLDKLKRHWAGHETTRKRNDIRRLQQLQPLRTNFPVVDAHDDDLDGSQQWLQKEMDRRKALLSGTRSSNRKVFSGSKHTRTLSLLSPDKIVPLSPFLTDGPTKKSSPPTFPPKPFTLERSSTNPDNMISSVISPTKGDDLFTDLTGAPKEVILRTGKQMVGDIKDGLWTFFEDIRQATVGEEGVNGTGTRTNTPSHNPSRRSAQHDKKLARHSTALITSQPRAMPRMTPDALVDSSFWRDHGVEVDPFPPRRSASTRRSRSSRVSASIIPTPQKPKDIEDSWDMWGTPIRTPASSTPVSTASAASAAAAHSHYSPSHSSRTSTTCKSSTAQEPTSPFTEDSERSDPTAPSTRPGSPMGLGIANFTIDGDATITPQIFGSKPKSIPASSSLGAKSPIPAGSGSVSDASISGGNSPWPTSLAKLTPGNLKRTASHLMSEWERSIQSGSPDSGLGYGSLKGGSGDERNKSD
jgi:hypothetical protein